MITLEDAIERARLASDDSGILSNYTYNMIVDQLSDSEKYEFTLSLVDLGIHTKTGSNCLVDDLHESVKVATKKATPVSDREIENEYGDVEDYDLFEVEYESELDYGGMAVEEFNHASVVMSLLGYDVPSMSPKEISEVVRRKPELLNLQPKYDVSGSWVHVIRQIDMAKLARVAKDMSKVSNEICVTDANESPFWDFSEYRRFALVFNGVCKVLWNADVFSSSSEGVLTAVDKPIVHLDEMTEGWLIPSECELVGVQCKDLEPEESQEFLKILEELGLPESQEIMLLKKQVVGFSVIEFEDAQSFYDIPYDFGEIDIFEIDNPEMLYEEMEDGDTVLGRLNKQLLSFATSGDVEGVRRVLEAGADLHANEDEALRWDSRYGRTEIVKLLLEYGADVHANEDEALRLASEYGRTEVVKLLLGAGADVHANEDEALQGASRYGHTEIVKLLLEYGADVHAEDEEALRRASDYGRTEVVKLLLEYGADLHAENDEALRRASQYGYTEVVKLLLEAGADISVLSGNKQKEYAKYVPVKKAGSIWSIEKKKAQTFKQAPSGMWVPDTWGGSEGVSDEVPSEAFYGYKTDEDVVDSSLYDLYDLERHKGVLEDAGIKIDRNGMVTFYQTNIPGVYKDQIPMKPVPMDKALALLESNSKMVEQEQGRVKSLQDVLSRLNGEFSGLDSSVQDVISNFDDVLSLLEQFKYSEKSMNQDISAIASGLTTIRNFLSESGPELEDFAYGLGQHTDVITDMQSKLDWYYQSQYEKGSGKQGVVEAMEVFMDVYQNDPETFSRLVTDMGGIAASFKRAFFVQKMSTFKDTGRLVTEEDIRLVHSYGVKNPDDFFSMDTGVLDRALQLGQLGYELGPVGHCYRYGKIPYSSMSFNYRDQYAEKGVSVISFEEDESGSSGANLFMSDRSVVEFDGILIEGAVGSDGENLVLPVNYYSLIDDLSEF